MKFVLSFLVLIFSYNLALGCTCANSSEEDKAKTLKLASAIFEGEVISVTPLQTEDLKDNEGKKYGERKFYNAEFKVIKSWKDYESKAVSIETSLDSCSPQYKVGDKAVVVAVGKPLTTSFCVRGSIPVEKFSEILGESRILDEATLANESFWSTLWRKITSFFS